MLFIIKKDLKLDISNIFPKNGFHSELLTIILYVYNKVIYAVTKST